MNYFTSSMGILRNSQIPKLFSATSVRKLSKWRMPALSNQDCVIGWGYKPNTVKSRTVAAKQGVPYLALEDGFIGWLNHPSQSKAAQRLSYVVDDTGIYYDASKPSGLDACLNTPSQLCETRLKNLVGQLTKLGISKYNQARQTFPKWLSRLSSNPELKILLLIDQTYGDTSIKLSGGSEKSFSEMLAWAVEKLKADPCYSLVIKTHPDVILGKKQGYLNSEVGKSDLTAFKNRIHILSQDISPKALFSISSEVATVSSQLGFEALWYDKKVTCFTWPFYAGRGLTDDKNKYPLAYERKQTSLLQLIQGALIDYPVYLNPETQAICEVEDIVNYLQAHFITREFSYEYLAIPNVSLWKRSFIPEFIAGSTKSLAFSSKMLFKGAELIWGMKPSVSPNTLHDVLRMEDGFIRSAGLGADLRRPSSLVLDDEGIYYNGKESSRLENLLNNYELSNYEQVRASALRQRVIESSVTKYNVDSEDDVSILKKKAFDKEIILVTGQFQQDLSMEFGAIDIKDNLSLLQQVRADYPNAYLIYKEHPDVYSGVRPGRLSGESVLNYADEYLTDTSLLSLFNIADRVCTICSLSGFEALIRGIKVSTYGLPFYAGWGLSHDRYGFTRRNKTRTIDELCFISLVLYARYINWDTRKITTPEYVIELMKNKSKGIGKLKSSWVARQLRKLGYLFQALVKSPDTKLAGLK